jgi:N-methylhydantoinase A
VPLEEAWLGSGNRERIGAAFHAAHRATYNHAAEENEVWLKELRVHISGALPRRRARAVGLGPAEAGGMRSIRLFGQIFEAIVVGRASLGTGDTLAGPAIVNQMDTTTLIPPGWEATLAPSGALVLQHIDAKVSG